MWYNFVMKNAVLTQSDDAKELHEVVKRQEAIIAKITEVNLEQKL